MSKRHLMRFALAGTILALFGQLRAESVFVSIDTSLLVVNAAGPFSIGFELADGSGTGDGNNTVTASNFQFAGGNPTGFPNYFEGAGGDLSSAVTLTDSFVFGSSFSQTFSPGSTLTFDLAFTNNVDPGTPDEFVFVILDDTDTPIPTTGGIALIQIDFDSAMPTIQTFAGDPTQTLGAGGPGIAIPAPEISSTAPEPSTFGLCGGCLAGLIFAFRRVHRCDAPRIQIESKR